MRVFAGVLLTVVTGMVAVSPAVGAIAYLPSVGPAPLRFELTTDPGASLAWKSLRPLLQPGAGTGILIPAAQTTTNATNDVVSKASSLPATNVISTASVLAADQGERKNSDTIPEPMIFPGQTDESSSPVTAQILAGFFKPVPGVKNPDGTVVFVPAEIEFIPPSARPVNESQAIYKSQ